MCSASGSRNPQWARHLRDQYCTKRDRPKGRTGRITRMADHLNRFMGVASSSIDDIRAPIGRVLRRVVIGVVAAMIGLFGGLVVAAPHARAGLAPAELVYLYDV